MGGRPGPKWIRTDEECPLDECSGEMFEYEEEKVCGSCYYVHGPPPKKDMPGPWDRFVKDREEWLSAKDGRGGWTGRERVRMIGGFIGVYVYGEGDSIESRVYG